MLSKWYDAKIFLKYIFCKCLPVNIPTIEFGWIRGEKKHTIFFFLHMIFSITIRKIDWKLHVLRTDFRVFCPVFEQILQK